MATLECGGIAIAQNDDMELVGVFTRRDPASVKIATAGVSVYHSDDREEKCRIKLMLWSFAGGSATDLPNLRHRNMQNCLMW